MEVYVVWCSKDVWFSCLGDSVKCNFQKYKYVKLFLSLIGGGDKCFGCIKFWFFEKGTPELMRVKAPVHGVQIGVFREKRSKNQHLQGWEGRVFWETEAHEKWYWG